MAGRAWCPLAFRIAPSHLTSTHLCLPCLPTHPPSLTFSLQSTSPPNNQAMAKLLHKAIGLGGQGAAGQAAYDAYTQHFRDAPVHVLRDMLELKSELKPIPIEEVEPAAGEAC